MRGDSRLDLRDGGEPEQVDPVELVGALAHVDMGVVEAGRDQPAAGIDDFCAWATQVAEAVFATPDPGDPSSSHCDRIRGRDGRHPCD